MRDDSIPKHLLRFSVRLDAEETLDAVRLRVEKALGCALSPAHKYRMSRFAGEILGMEILLGEWRGIEGRRVAIDLPVIDAAASQRSRQMASSFDGRATR